MKLSTGLEVVVVVLTALLAISQSEHQHHFISTNNEILTALTWAAVDPDLLGRQESWLTSLGDLNKTLLAYSNVTQGLSKPRRKRTIQLQLNGDIYVAFQIKFIIPLFEVYEGTFLRFELPMSSKIPFPLEPVNVARTWDTLGPVMTHIEDLVSVLGVDGKVCVKRSVCEMAAAPSLNLHGFVGEVVRIFIRHLTEDSIEEDPSDNYIDDPEKPSLSKGEYIKAGAYGRQKGDCWRAYPECPFSIFNLLANS